MKSFKSRSGTRVSLYVGLGLILPFLIGQGCPLGGQVDKPVVTIIAPAVTNQLEIGNPVTLIYSVSNPGGGDISISAFYDRDGQANTGDEVGFATNLPAGENRSVTLDTSGLAEGNLYLGIVAVNSAGTTVAYASGARILVDSGAGTPAPSDGSTGRDGLVGGIAPGTGDGDDLEPGDGSADPTSQLLVMTAPASDLRVIRGATFTVRWRTKLQLGEGVINIFREPDANNDMKPDGEGARVVLSQPGLDASTLQFVFDTTGLTGRHFIGATVIPNEGDPVTRYAPGSITVVPPLFWVGDLITKYDERGNAQPLPGPMEGAIFRGHNFGDNLGSAMVVAPDFNGDGINEIIIGAQFGKPQFQAFGGRGAGEAYMFYGQAGRGLIGSIEVNQAGSANTPGVIFQGIFPNPNPSLAPQGNSLMNLVNGFPPAPFSSEGLRSIITIPDQDGDGIPELAFSFPFCDSYRLRYQILDGYHPAPWPALGRLENNGQFMRGGVVIVSSTNSILQSNGVFSRHGDRTMMLQEVGQFFSEMRQIYGGAQPRPDAEDADFGGVPIALDLCPFNCPEPDLLHLGTLDGDGNDTIHFSDTVVFPGEGFTQDTQTQTEFPIFELPFSGTFGAGQLVNNFMGIDPPRLADPPLPRRSVVTGGGSALEDLMIWAGEMLNANQIDPPPLDTGGKLFSLTCPNPIPGSNLDPFGLYPSTGLMRVLGTGFYYESLPTAGLQPCNAAPPYLCPACGYCPENRLATPLEPIGARLFGQANQVNPTNPATRELVMNRFGHSMAVSGDFLLIGAPERTAIKADITAMRNNPSLTDRPDSGEIYMLQMVRSSLPRQHHLWDISDPTIPAPFQYIIQDLGYTKCEVTYLQPGNVAFEMMRPFHIVGASPGDRIGDVTALADMNNDGVEDFAVGGEGTVGDRGSIYVIYRRQPELEADYLLERLHISPTSLDRLNGLYIVGRQGERLGTSLAGGGDFNNDGFPDMLIGSPFASTARGFQSGEVFILFGGTNLLSKQGGVTIPELRDAGRGMTLAGANARDHAGITVANAGDVNGDGIDDILIAAPEASPRFDSTGDGVPDAIGIDFNGDLTADDLNGDGEPDDLTGAGLVYIVFGGEHLTGTINLSEIGTENLPGLTIVGRKAGYHLGGGYTQNGLLSRGVAPAGDVDGDGLADFFVSSVLADPEGKTEAGEVYLLYGGFDVGTGSN